MWCSLYGFLIIKLQIALHYVVWCGFCGLVNTLMCIRNYCQKLTMIYTYIYIYIYEDSCHATVKNSQSPFWLNVSA